ncbi:transcriptional regulator [Vibrio sp. JCM 19236]|nr:transcriptional regulator [Vibrio sp. JCM 19236]
MKIEDLKLFVKVVELGSFTAAANSLELPRANVSRRINELENSLDIKLFHRTTRSLSLTHHGEVYYEELLKALEMLENANQVLYRDTKKVAGKVKLGLLPDSLEFLQPLLFDFMEQYPEVTLDIRNITNGFDEMFEQGLDFAFHGGELRDSDIVARKLFSVKASMVSSPEYLSKHNEIRTLEDLNQHQVLCLRWPTGDVYSQYEHNGETIDIEPKLISNSLSLIKNAILSGKGIGVLPNIITQESLVSGELVQVLTDSEVKWCDCYILHPQSRTLTAASRALIEYFMKVMPETYQLS